MGKWTKMGQMFGGFGIRTNPKGTSSNFPNIFNPKKENLLPRKNIYE
jgi:hypothetical protein